MSKENTKLISMDVSVEMVSSSATDEKIMELNPEVGVQMEFANSCVEQQPADWRRWLVLANFVVFSMSNSIQWICLSPVVSQAKEYFDINSFQVDMMSLSYLFVFPFVAPFTAFSFDRLGYKPTLVAGTLLNMLAAVGRLCAVLLSPNFTPLILSQLLAAVAQGTCIAAPPVVADLWFPARERTMANTIGANSVNLGIALGLLVPPLLVDEDKKGRDNFANLCGGFVLAVTVVAFLSTLLIPPESAVPMSPFAKKKNQGQTASFEDEDGFCLAETTPSHSSFVEVLSSAKVALQSRDFLLLNIAIGVGVGGMWAFSTVYTQIFSPFGITQKDSGFMGAVNIVAGAAFAIPTSAFLDKYKLYKGPLLVAMITVLVAESLLFLVFRVFDSVHFIFPLTFALYTLVGLAQALVGGVGMELGAEISFPLSAAVAGAVLMSSASVVGFGMTVGVAALLGDDPNKDQASYALLIFLGTGAAAVGCIVPLKVKLKRREHEELDLM